MSDLTPTAIVEEMQKLDDIEADLAETALAIVQDPAPSDQDSNQMSSSDTREGSEILMQNAEAVEHVLEEAIPPAPSITPTPASQTDIIQPSPIAPATAVEAIPDKTTPPFTTSTPALVQTTTGYDPSVPQDYDYPTEQQSDLANETMETLHAVEDDVDVPILPSEIGTSLSGPEEAKPVVKEGDIGTPHDSQSTSLINSEQQQESLEVPQATIARDPSPLEQPVVIPPNAGLPPKPEPVPQTHAPIEEFRPDVDFPAGITASSPSVLANPDLLRAWARGEYTECTTALFRLIVEPKNPNIILAFFNWAVQKSEVTDARAWYELLSIDEPTAVS